MQSSDIHIEVVYNGLIVRLNLNRQLKTEPTIETFIFKNMKEFLGWFNKNLSSPEKSTEFLNRLLKIRAPSNLYGTIDQSWEYLTPQYNTGSTTNASSITTAGSSIYKQYIPKSKKKKIK